MLVISLSTLLNSITPLSNMVDMIANPFVPNRLVGRQAELNQVSSILATDGDLLVAGVPGSGRQQLIQDAARMLDARVIEIDCLRATDSHRFLKLLAEGILSAFKAASELALIQRWSTLHPFILDTSVSDRPRLVWHSTSSDEWQLFQTLLTLPQVIAEWLNCRIVIVFQNFPHIRSWDRSEKWENYLRQEIQSQSRVSYALIATVTENWVQQSNLQVVFLGPIKDEDLQEWLSEASTAHQIELADSAIELFLEYAQGHLGSAISLLRRIWLDLQSLQLLSLNRTPNDSLIGQSAIFPIVTLPHQSVFLTVQAHQVHRSALALVEDLVSTFESLLLLLPSSQVRVLESLALDPTDSPHSREYIQKHRLSRGGGLQGALASLQQKGLVYGPEYGYRITMPLLALWLKQRLA